MSSSTWIAPKGMESMRSALPALKGLTGFKMVIIEVIRKCAYRQCWHRNPNYPSVARMWDELKLELEIS